MTMYRNFPSKDGLIVEVLNHGGRGASSASSTSSFRQRPVTRPEQKIETDLRLAPDAGSRVCRHHCEQDQASEFLSRRSIGKILGGGLIN